MTNYNVAADDWKERCALHLLETVPGLDEEGAEEFAANLHRAWPGLTPECAAEHFLAPVPMRGAGLTVRELD